MFVEICMQINSAVFALNRDFNMQTYTKTINPLCAGNKVFVTYQAQGGRGLTPTPPCPRLKANQTFFPLESQPNLPPLAWVSEGFFPGRIFPKFFPGGAKSGEICLLPLEIEKKRFFANDFKIQGGQGLPFPSLPTPMSVS